MMEIIIGSIKVLVIWCVFIVFIPSTLGIIIGLTKIVAEYTYKELKKGERKWE